MSDLARALVQFACEATIYGCERILETLAARRPDHGDPLPDVDPWQEAQDRIAAHLHEHHTAARELARRTAIPTPLYPTRDTGAMESDGPMASQLLPDDYPDWLNGGPR